MWHILHFWVKRTQFLHTEKVSDSIELPQQHKSFCFVHFVKFDILTSVKYSDDFVSASRNIAATAIVPAESTPSSTMYLVDMQWVPSPTLRLTVIEFMSFYVH